MIFTIQLKQHVANAYVFGIIIYKLKYQQDLDLIIQLKFDKGLKICLHFTGLTFCLTVSPEVKHYKKPLLNTEKVAK